ncbi:hydrogenase 2 maturation protease [Thermosulfidibacter takaii ABI70S6]|uniref:Hydrogenase 2 maturation protease n=1 Tax=Thermosulfidibacter takaii (strain DSM 17441 / JCM 13301 / NBRC 103674 / ABI70S6) TaxID=1298851 RepID=A0A0S3QUC7_THET7|nr:hydrogenase maturation protease [Thermosulfidibacter takaii]BAT71936.1 hydrogenase 2 maturation protease [Thermosulfidibacter takaii ABI70S6]
MRIAVIGLGNVLLGDDGVGVEAVRLFAQKFARKGVNCIDGGTSIMELPLYDYDAVVFVDAVRIPDKKPGEVVILKKEEIMSLSPSIKVSGHSLSIVDYLRILDFSDELPQEIFLVGIVGKKYDLGLGISEECREAIEEACRRIAILIDGLEGQNAHS